MLKFTESSVSGIIKTIDQLQKTNITFLDEENKLHEGMSLLPYYGFLANKNILEIKLFIRIAIKRKYTNIKDLMKFKSPHTLRFLEFLIIFLTYLLFMSPILKLLDMVVQNLKM